MARSRYASRDEEDLVELYFIDIGRHALLSKDDEIGLAQRIEAGAEARPTTRRSGGIEAGGPPTS